MNAFKLHAWRLATKIHALLEISVAERLVTTLINLINELILEHFCTIIDPEPTII